MPLVSRLAYASYTESWDDKDFIETMQTIPTFALEDGNYLWFEVKGDSMSSDASPSIEEGDYILGRELYREHWDHLQLKRTKVWVIHHQEKGLMLKEIIRQSGSEIECRSWNPIVKNFTLDLKDIVQMFYFKELRKTKLL